LSPQAIVRVKLRGRAIKRKAIFKASDFEILKPLKPLKPFFFESHFGRVSIPITAENGFSVNKETIIEIEKNNNTEKFFLQSKKIYRVIKKNHYQTKKSFLSFPLCPLSGREARPSPLKIFAFLVNPPLIFLQPFIGRDLASKSFQERLNRGKVKVFHFSLDYLKRSSTQLWLNASR